MDLKSGVKWAFLGLLLVVTPTFAEVLTLDLQSDETKEWLEISCVYVTDPKDFWVFGCPADIPDGEDRFPTQDGYWSPCVSRCTFQYSGGDGAPPPKSITLNSYSRGDSPEISITSKYSPLDEEFSDLETVRFDGKSGWVDTIIPIDSPRARILNIVLISNPGDMLLLDKIIIDLGEEGTLPPPTTPTTTQRPIVDDVLTLEKESDYWSVWDHTCVYTDDPNDMWAYGCPASTEVGREENAGLGFWSTCTKSKCRIQYKTHLFLPPPSSVTVNGYLVGDTQVEVVLQLDPLDFKCNACIPIGVVKSTGNNGGVVSQTFQLDWISSKAFRLNFNLMNENGQAGGAVIDNIKVKLRPMATLRPPTNDPTMSTTTTEGSPGGGGGGGGGDNNNANAVKINWANLWLLLCLCLFGIK